MENYNLLVKDFEKSLSQTQPTFLIDHQIQSYNAFIEFLKTYKAIFDDYTIENISFHLPVNLPLSEIYLRNLSHTCKVKCCINKCSVTLFELPIMLKSTEDFHSEKGGIFVLDGKEFYFQCYEDFCGLLFSSNTVSYKDVLILYDETKKIFLVNDMPLFIFFRALGIISDRDIINFCSTGNTDMYEYFHNSVLDAEKVFTRKQARNNVPFIDAVLSEDYKSKNVEKAYFIGYMTWRLLQIIIETHVVNNNNRTKVVTCGDKLKYLFLAAMSNQIDLWKSIIKQSFEETKDCVNEFTVFSEKYNILNMSIVENWRKFLIPLQNSDDYVEEIRRIKCMNPDNFGYGFIYDSALSVSARIATQSSLNIDNLFPDIIKLSDISFPSRFCKVFSNNIWIGCILRPIESFNELKDKKKNGVIDPLVSIFFDYVYGELHINTYEGRIMRPLVSIRRHGEMFIEYIDPIEQRLALIAPNYMFVHNVIQQKYNYVEIDPDFILNYSDSKVPMYNQNRQYPKINDKLTKLIVPQNPLIITKFHHYILFPSIYQNICAAVMSCCNQVIVNNSAVHRGLFSSFTIKTLEFVESDVIGYVDIKNIANISKKRSWVDFSKLSSEGVIRKGEQIYNNTAIVGRIFKNSDNEIEEQAVLLTEDYMGYYCENYTLRYTTEGMKLIKLSLRKNIFLEQGDILQFRNGTKIKIDRVADEIDMPFSHDGFIPDIIIDPMVFLNTQSPGILIELYLGSFSAILGGKIEYNPLTSLNYEKLQEFMISLGYHHSKGESIFYDGCSGNQIKGNIFTGISACSLIKKRNVFDETFACDKMFAENILTKGCTYLSSELSCRGGVQEVLNIPQHFHDMIQVLETMNIKTTLHYEQDIIKNSLQFTEDFDGKVKKMQAEKINTNKKKKHSKRKNIIINKNKFDFEYIYRPEETPVAPEQEQEQEPEKIPQTVPVQAVERSNILDTEGKNTTTNDDDNNTKLIQLDFEAPETEKKKD